MRKVSGRIISWPLLMAVACSLGSTQVRAQTEEQKFEDAVIFHQPVQVQSARDLRANIEAYNGRTVELRGDITGLMTREGTRTVLLRIDGDTTVLSAPPEIENPVLRAGSSVRLVARVDTRQSTPLVLIAVTGAPRMAATPKKPDPEVAASTSDAAFILPEAPPASSSPFVSTVPTPQPQPRPLASRSGGPRVTRPASRPSQSSPASLPSSSSFDVEEVIQSQKPMYEALVRRHNKKIKLETVSEIAEGLMRAGFKYNMDPRFLAAIIAVESNFDPHCVSRSGAMGLGQIMPFNLKKADISNPWSPTQNIFGTAKLLRGLLDSYKSRSNGTLLAVAAYNAGEGAVRRAGYKVPNGQQVQRYVWKVHDRYKQFAPDMF